MKTINIRNEDHKKLKLYSTLYDKTIADLVNEGISLIIKKYETPNLEIINKDGETVIREWSSNGNK